MGMTRRAIVGRQVRGHGTPEARSRRTVYVDADGSVVADAGKAVSGEIVDALADGTQRRRAWFRVEEVELDWLPVRESAFLLWVLAFLAAVWFCIGVVLHFT